MTIGEDTPDDIRRRVRAERGDLDGAARAKAARGVAARVAALVAGRRPGRVGGYLPTDGELDPTLAVELLRDRGWLPYVPVIGELRSMAFVAWPTGAELVTNRHGIAEPAERSDPLAARELDLVLVPCVAVDPAGNRLGFGAGYYDRALADAEDPHMRSSRPRPLLVGTVYDMQVVPHLERRPWDVPLDVITSESATLLTGARAWPPER